MKAAVMPDSYSASAIPLWPASTRANCARHWLQHVPPVPRHGAGRLHHHVEIVAVGKTPHDLANVVAGSVFSVCPAGSFVLVGI